jgi:hypothetical protein
VFISKVDGEAGDRFWIDSAGIMRWGDGTDFAADANLYLAATGRLASASQLNPTEGVATKVKAGTVSDTDFTVTPVSGMLAVDTSNRRLYVRVGSTWKYVTLS